MLTILNYGVGNLASIKNMLKRVGIEAVISSDEQDIQQAAKIILPGVGAFDTCAQKLQESGVTSLLKKKVYEDKIPLLGICVGMQLLLEGSEEGVLPGLGWIKGKNVRFDVEKLPQHYKVPHIGWTEVTASKKSALTANLETEARFYFVHSYHAQLANPADELFEADYGYRFTAGIQHENIFGVQFHPEKSHRFGRQLLENFVMYR
ncbi:MAG: Imidazole glycerol phosphate synthase amidotransferase subunit HisH [Cytophagales bacterium]|jgi:glutamine amidotransferase|nr:imidazole glycerol phosphate synthase subunit HisH [Bacteroidota bacterium]MBS1981574.1 imidazole glycerol phosphate synthase subunit HisH [Bacteroidota bacterium]WHZ08880.1 MAG: Imidazole glycerol phosphate synthase amidotransferase subunit HisH [Cytophagales bacterium]